MNETVRNYLNKIKTFWGGRTKKQRTMYITTSVALVLIIAVAAYFGTRTTLVPLYSNLTPSETGSIKESLDGRGVQSQIADGGTTIMVPQESVDTLKVELAAEGIPKSGNIDYSFFSQNAGIGMTENEFNVLKLDAMQTELAELMKGIEGVQDAKVMINLPEQSIFVNDKEDAASASIVLNTKPGYQFKEEQIKSLYHLVSKSVPNLPTANIVIMNQMFEYFDLNEEKNNLAGASFTTQHEIKKQIERDVQRQVQNMLGTLMGQDKVIATVTADLDFTQENREENLVAPVDEENMKGLEISVQRVTETFSGKGATPGGTPGAGENEIANYNETNGETNGDYEKVEETINNEVNRIRKQIVESPYKVRDLGIQVMVEPPTPDDPNSLPQERVEDITKILSAIVRTTIDKNNAEETLSDEAIEDKIVVSVQPFKGKVEFPSQTEQAIPMWVYIVGGVLVAIIGLLLFLFIRSRKKRQEEDELMEEISEPIFIPDVNDEKETENSMRKKQLEKMAKDKPEEFAKLLRTWIAED